MDTTPLASIMTRLMNREQILPHLETTILSDRWPDKYTIEVDSSPYYGRGDGYFHPSTHPLMGARQLYYMFHPEHQKHLIPERRNLNSHMILAMGSALHATIQTQMTMTGLVKDPANIEVEYVNHEHHVRGRIDFIVDGHPSGKVIPVELKTASPWVVKKLEGKPQLKWVAQLSLGMDAIGHDEGIILILERSDPATLHEMPIRKDVQLLDEIYTKFDYVRDCIQKDTPPRYCCTPNSNEMKACPARTLCWMKDQG